MPMVDDIPKRFRKNVECSTHVDVAVAWATETSALAQLENAVWIGEHRVSLRTIVGTYGNATDPNALDRLNAIGKLRLARHGTLFHPKIYIFRGKESSIAWIGSANFTNGGFGGNVEAVFETKEWESALRWFEDQWKECGELPANAIEDYRRSYKGPSKDLIMDLIGTPGRDPGKGKVPPGWQRYKVRRYTGDRPDGRDIRQPMSPTGKMPFVTLTPEEKRIQDQEAVLWPLIEWSIDDRIAFQWARDECYVGTIIGVTAKEIKILFDFQRVAAKEDGVPLDSKGYTYSPRRTSIRVLGRVGDRRAHPDAMPLERIMRLVTDVGAPGLRLDKGVPKELLDRLDRSSKVVQPPRARRRTQGASRWKRTPDVA